MHHAFACDDLSVARASEDDLALSRRQISSLDPKLLLAAIWRSLKRRQFLGRMVRGKPGFRNLPVSSVDQAIKTARRLSEEGFETYFACAEYGQALDRTASNVVSASVFYFDLDCGADKAFTGKGYSSTDEARAQLYSFCSKTGLPRPTHEVESGGGLHVYYGLSDSVPRDDWIASARKLKALTTAHGLFADPSRTADIASVLRVPGTLNYKYDPPRPVVLVKASEALDRDELLAAIDRAHDVAFPQAVEAPAVARTADDGRVGGHRDSTDASSFGPPDLDNLRSALAQLDPDCDEATWKLSRLAPIARAARAYPSLEDDLYRLAMEWSSGELRGEPSKAWTTPGLSNGLTGKETFPAVWQRFVDEQPGDGHIGLGTVFHDARQVSWNRDAPRSGAVVSTADRAVDIAKTVVERVRAGDVGAAFEEASLAGLLRLAQNDKPEFQRIRRELKSVGVSWMALDAALKEARIDSSPADTHHGYAVDLLSRLTVDGFAPVAHDGSLFVVDPEKRLWVRKDPDRLESDVAEHYDGKTNCKKKADYSAIARHAVSLAADQTFFTSAPVGLAAAGRFYRVTSGQTAVEPLTPDHRQRVAIDFEPADMPTPMFDAFLHETFKSPTAGEEAQQIALVQEMAGSIMLGIAPRFQKAFLWQDPYGRAGKGTLESILRLLVPRVYVTAVSPFKWNKDYFLATMANARLNVVGELPDGEPIPAAQFKTVLGGDLLTGRNPAGRPFVFRNEAAHLFMSNHMITSKDQSEAFFARWQIVEFPNSRLLSGLPLDAGLADRIIEQEMPGIADWALKGAARLLEQKSYSKSLAHDRLMQKWRRSNSSLNEFIDEYCELDRAASIKRSVLYAIYVDWCKENTRKPFSKSSVKDLLSYNVGLGITWATLDGYEIFRGIRLKHELQLESVGR